MPSNSAVRDMLPPARTSAWRIACVSAVWRTTRRFKLGGFTATLAYAPSEAPSNAPKDGRYAGVKLGYASPKLMADLAHGSTTLAAIGDLTTTSFGASYDFGFIKPMFEIVLRAIRQVGRFPELHRLVEQEVDSSDAS